MRFQFFLLSILTLRLATGGIPKNIGPLLRWPVAIEFHRNGGIYLPNLFPTTVANGAKSKTYHPLIGRRKASGHGWGLGLLVRLPDLNAVIGTTGFGGLSLESIDGPKPP